VVQVMIVVDGDGQRAISKSSFGGGGDAGSK
jgi:hypothetical protein